MVNKHFTYNLPDLNIGTADNPIIIYKSVQTGANIQRGGLNIGLLSAIYQEKSLILTAKPERKPNTRQIIIDSIYNL
jgi:hypothetical protein